MPRLPQVSCPTCRHSAPAKDWRGGYFIGWFECRLAATPEQKARYSSPLPRDCADWAALVDKKTIP